MLFNITIQSECVRALHFHASYVCSLNNVLYYPMHEGPDASIDNCSSMNVLPRQVTLVWSLDQLLMQNIAVTGYTLNCSSIGNIITTSATITSVTITTGIVPYTNYTCTLAAETTAGTSAPTTCEFETAQDSESIITL